MSTAAPEEGWLRGGWIQTFTGGQFWPLSPRIEDLDVRDIAHSLSLQCRYNGHCDRFYSVAEHCVLVSYAVPAEDALWGLMHDAAEAYVGDMVRPLKRDMPDFQAAEDKILELIAARYGLNGSTIPASVHEADSRILLTERAELLGQTRHSWGPEIEGLEPLDVEIRGRGPWGAEHAWRARFDELYGAMA